MFTAYTTSLAFGMVYGYFLGLRHAPNFEDKSRIQVKVSVSNILPSGCSSFAPPPCGVSARQQHFRKPLFDTYILYCAHVCVLAVKGSPAVSVTPKWHFFL